MHTQLVVKEIAEINEMKMRLILIRNMIYHWNLPLVTCWIGRHVGSSNACPDSKSKLNSVWERLVNIDYTETKTHYFSGKDNAKVLAFNLKDFKEFVI